jgi:hypothetical protein
LLARPSRAECDRLGVPYGPVLLDDYKTSSSIQRYALTEAELLADVQANLYGYATCVEFGQDFTPARWVYFETKKVRRAKAVDVDIHHDAALAVLEPACALARQLDTLVYASAAAKNPLACGDYGGCQYHQSRGGPCDARRSIGGLIQARVKKKEPTMAISPDIKSKFSKLKGAAPADAPAEAPAEGDAPEGETETEAAETPAPKAAAPSKRAKLLADLEAAEAKVAEARARLLEAL